MRVDKWSSLLAAEIQRSQSLPFEYGKHDCLQFVARCVKVMTGEDHAAGFGEYTDPTEILNELGGVQGILTGIFGAPWHPSQAADGDILLADIRGTMSAGISFGSKLFFVSDRGGLVVVPRSMTVACWKP